MFNKSHLVGILVGLANCDIRVESNYRSTLGYDVKPRIHIRGSLDFLKEIERSLLQHEITCSIKEKESKARNKPVLIIRRIMHLQRLCNMIEESLGRRDFTDARNQWHEFRLVIELIKNKKHLTLEGLEQILEIKGLI